MKHLLFIGHTYHQKTKSADFVLEMLEEKYDVQKFYINPDKDNINKFSIFNGAKFDIIVLWQIMPNIDELKSYISAEHWVFFPMYDGVPSRLDTIWYEYRDTQIINFSKTLHDELKKLGFSSQHIQYFPEPIKTKNMGKGDSVFFWQRINQINSDLVCKLLSKTKISHLHFHKAIDPNNTIQLPDMNCKITTSEWFETREEMQEKMLESAIYIAPRLYEGIGMSFLEAMAMGRCVIAPNYPTMNEYIEDGITGYLYDWENIKPIEIKDIKSIQRNTLAYIQKGYKKWEKEKHKILEWLESDLENNVNKLKKYYYERAEIITYKLFNFLPIIKVKKSIKKCKIKLFGFLPLVTIRKK